MNIYKYFIILIISISNSFAIEWNTDEMNKSFTRWSDSVKKYKEHPSLIKEDIKEKYNGSVENVVKPIQKKYENEIFYFEKKYAKKAKAFNHFGDRAKTYTKLYGGQVLYQNVMYDVENTFPMFWREVVEELPLVVPLQLEINNRVDSMRIYPYMLMPYVRGIKQEIKNIK